MLPHLDSRCVYVCKPQASLALSVLQWRSCLLWRAAMALSAVPSVLGAVGLLHNMVLVGTLSLR